MSEILIKAFFKAVVDVIEKLCSCSPRQLNGITRVVLAIAVLCAVMGWALG